MIVKSLLLGVILSFLQLNLLLNDAQFAMLFRGTCIFKKSLYIMHVFNKPLFFKFIIDNLAAAPDDDNEGARLLFVEDDDNPSA